MKITNREKNPNHSEYPHINMANEKRKLFKFATGQIPSCTELFDLFFNPNSKSVVIMILTSGLTPQTKSIRKIALNSIHFTCVHQQLLRCDSIYIIIQHRLQFVFTVYHAVCNMQYAKCAHTQPQSYCQSSFIAFLMI